MAERKSVSMQDLADKLGISKVTVSKALNGKDGVGEELKEKIFALARESGYVLPDYGKRKSKKVGIIMSPRFSSGDEGKFYMAMYERIIYELQRASCSSIMISPTTATLPSDMNTIQTRLHRSICRRCMWTSTIGPTNPIPSSPRIFTAPMS